MEMIREDMRYIVTGCAVLDAAMLLTALCLGRFTLPFALSVLLSSLFSILNLVLMIMHLKSSVLKTPHGARRRAMGNYLVRLLILGVLIYLGLTREYLDPVGTILPLLFPKIILSCRLLRTKGGQARGYYN